MSTQLAILLGFALGLGAAGLFVRWTSRVAWRRGAVFTLAEHVSRPWVDNFFGHHRIDLTPREQALLFADPVWQRLRTDVPYDKWWSVDDRRRFLGQMGGKLFFSTEPVRGAA